MRHPLATTCLTLALASVFAGPVQAQIDDRLNTLLTLCSTCHGEGGVSTSPEFPSLAGQHEPYLFESLKELKSEKSSSPIMQGITKDLSEDDLKRLANHFASQPYRRNPQAADPEKVVRGKEVYLRLCQLCHRDEGRATGYVEYPLLAGQGLDYLLRSMDHILQGTRRVEAIKRDMLALASRDKTDDAIHFFASQKVTPDQVVTSINPPEKRSRRNRFKN